MNLVSRYYLRKIGIVNYRERHVKGLARCLHPFMSAAGWAIALLVVAIYSHATAVVISASALHRLPWLKRKTPLEEILVGQF
jgi:hypothetical protein